jgi:hypothetical protein
MQNLLVLVSLAILVIERQPGRGSPVHPEDAKLAAFQLHDTHRGNIAIEQIPPAAEHGPLRKLLSVVLIQSADSGHEFFDLWRRADKVSQVHLFLIGQLTAP